MERPPGTELSLSRDLTTSTDEELMLQVRAGDSRAFGELYRRYERPVYSFLVRRTGDREVAAELFQETFLRVHRKSATFDVSRRFRSWLFGIAAHAAIDRGRKQVRRPVAVSLQEWDGQKEAHGSATDARLALEKGIAAMPATLREAFLLGAVEGFDHNEIADQLDISPANARARISRGRAWLRRFLGDA